MKVSIVIPNFNGAALLQENLPKVQHALAHFSEETGEKGEIIISDDHSTDTSKNVVSELYFPVHYLEHEKNAGFATNVNRGVSKAKGEIVVLLNTDVAPKKNFLISLIKHFSDTTVFAVGCMDESIEGEKTVLRGRGVGSWQRGFLVHKAGNLEKMYSLWASGGSSAFRRLLWEELGGMDEAFSPFYWEDIDLSYRAWKAGYTVQFEKESVVRHEHEKGTIKTHHDEKSITVTAYRNQFFFVWKNASGMLIFKHIIWLPYHLIHAILRQDFVFWRGFLAALPYWSKMRKKNTAFKKKQTRTDDAVIRMINE